MDRLKQKFTLHHHHKPTSPPSSPPTSRTAKDKRGSLPHSKDGFSIHRAIKAFSISSTTDGVAIDEFIDGYTEICKYLESFGVVFSFTMSDVRDKLRILSEYRSSKTGPHYITARGMLDYEIENKITNNKRQASGARTLLRLQRALEFIALLIDHIADAQPEAKAGPLAADAYKETLSKHHEWLVRKAVQLGMKSLSTCGHLIDRMGLSDHEERVKFAKQLVGVIRPLDDQLHKYYEERDLLSLP